ncbi:hypothetical protein RA263_09510 [Pseudomonas syringae pv. tagetis]|uniref:Uncharacterized protein n=3 Tax=Pseudomonas syringae group TaxID=136849 RepID=A0A0P9JW29_9PSED|nr:MULTISPECIES: hypothetical protein [Pseudomonas syringae group]KPW55522.1 Uncharacterized protein ALO80_02996 [Pseudomonas caricapapayae]KPX45497.1 Uncharacterized protein ALO68_04135 [Pseudomonas syringae pv. helianthi]KPY89475.1 Uncharacterized protein ALO44_04460 [Pseudomonas syringae pv. tagetis]RMM04614.1 hypothetical protein ALQ84_02188 [Pseudomonas caricapapayae]RMR09913.1 hypothetical protein ALP93_01979 [Pseudomonas syringae pv. helianthi]
MKAITRKCMVVIGALAVMAVYTAGAYRNELARQAPQVASCTFGHCVPTDATFSALR